MLNRQEAIELIDRLDGDELAAVDFKSDYYVLGLDNKKAEFIKDICSMANAITDHDQHYIIVGVDDDGNLLGVSDYDNESEPYHIMGIDDAKLQETIDEYLSPAPSVKIRKFTDKEPNFGIILIQPVKKKPCVIEKSLRFNGERKLYEGRIYTRHSSSKSIALYTDIDEMIDQRVLNRRKEILEGIRKATEIGPEAVAKVGSFVSEEDEGDHSVKISDDGDIEVKEILSREPVSDLDDQLIVDIKQWASRGRIAVNEQSIWEYYSNKDDIRIDEESVQYLTTASLSDDVKAYGAFWLTHVREDTAKEILCSARDGSHKNERIGDSLAAIGDKDALREFYEQISTSAVDKTDGQQYKRRQEYCESSENERLRQLISSKEHSLEHKDWNKKVNVESLELSKINELIQELADHLVELTKKSEGFDKWFDKKKEFRRALADAEIALLVREFSS